MGDVVRIVECRPMSKLKRWQLGEVIGARRRWARSRRIWT